MADAEDTKPKLSAVLRHLHEQGREKKGIKRKKREIKSKSETRCRCVRRVEARGEGMERKIEKRKKRELPADLADAKDTEPSYRRTWAPARARTRDEEIRIKNS